jgi:hypothetical protein
MAPRAQEHLHVARRLDRLGLKDAVIPAASRNARVILEGFSPGTGRKQWRFDAGHNVGLITFAAVLPPQVGSNRVLLRDARGRTVAVNLADGSRARVRGKASGWCKRPIFYKQSVRYQGSTGPIEQYVGQFAIFPCDAAGRRIAQPKRVAAFVGALGARLNGLVAWTETKKIVAAPVAR